MQTNILIVQGNRILFVLFVLWRQETHRISLVLQFQMRFGGALSQLQQKQRR